MTQIKPEYQGRVFAANDLVLQGVSALAVLLAGPLADRLLEPAMMSGNWLTDWLVPSFGNEAGAGMAVLYATCAMTMVGVGIGGFWLPGLRHGSRSVG
ncbi:MAG: hypothetical protein AAF773_00495 [Cyanobacteria bacterium P01_D01_bin.115]